ncbi:unnamed protein product [Diplocarpon coronariae]
MSMMKAPTSFNGVAVMDNTFEDILSNVASVVPGNLGLLQRASLNVAGKSIINPAAMILLVAMILKYYFGMVFQTKAWR